jgi:glycosyltransferase involved in cell wall biosynthesis
MFGTREGRFSAGDAARYVMETSAEMLGDAMIELLDDEAARTAMGEIGRRRLSTELCWDKSVEQLLNTYRLALL